MQRKVGLTLMGLWISSSAWAAPVTFFDTIPLGRPEFQTRVTNAGGTLYTDALSGLTNNATSWARTDFTITPSNGAGRSITTSALNPAPTSLPGGDAIRMTADGSTSSGLTFTFNTPINGFGLDLDDWATCCYPSSLYITFDGGTPILIGTANSSGDNPGTAAGQGPKTFIGTIDDSNTFTTITFYGTGSGDVLNAGGIIRYAVVPIGALSGNYVTAAASGTTIRSLAGYLDQFDSSGLKQTLANHLNSRSREQVARILKTVFPVNTAQSGITSMGSGQQTANVLIEKVGSVLGSVGQFAGGSLAASVARSQPNARVFDLATPEGRASLAAVQNNPSFLKETSALTYLAGQPYTKFKHGQQATWFQGVGAGSRGEETPLGNAYRSNSAGVVGGYEYAVAPDLLVGVLTSVFHTDVTMDNKAGDTEAVNYNVGLYGQRLHGDLKFTGMLMANAGRYESTRIINTPGVYAAPKAKYNGRGLTGSVGVSQLFKPAGAIQWEPFGQLTLGVATTEDYTEFDGGTFNTQVDGDEIASASVKAGVTLNYDATEWLGGTKSTLRVKPYVAQQMELNGSRNNVRFVGATNATSIDGQSLNVAQLGAAWEADMDVSKNQNLKLGLDLSADKFEQRYLGYVGWGMKF